MAYQLICCMVIGALVLLTSADVITSPDVTDWGTWAIDFERCPAGLAAQGFQILAEEGGFIDKTSMNGLRLFCGNPSDGATPQITSHIGEWGDWRNLFRCDEQGYITGFQLRVEKPGLVDDETATNNIRMWCTKNAKYIEGDGESKGEWREEDARHCPVNQVVCGIKTQIEPDRGNFWDDTALNNIAFDCCPHP